MTNVRALKKLEIAVDKITEVLEDYDKLASKYELTVVRDQLNHIIITNE